MGKRPVVAHRRADSADPAKAYGAQEDAPARQGKQNQARRGTQMDKHKPREHQPVMSCSAPPRPLPSWSNRRLGDFGFGDFDGFLGSQSALLSMVAIMVVCEM
jgi:hypothetical protein